MDVQLSNKVIDWNQLMDRGFDEEIVMNVVPICIDDNRERLPLLSEAIDNNDSDRVRLYAHSFKGSAANIGALNLSAAAGLLEDAAEQHDLSDAGRLFTKIEAEFARLEQFVSSPDWIDKLKSGRCE